MEQMDRLIQFDGVHNFRDIGGYRTESGRTVRWRRVFRSGALDEMTDDDERRARGEFGISAVIDLRHPDEMGTLGAAKTALAGTSVVYRNASLVPHSDTYRAYLDRVTELYGPTPSAERYRYLLTVAGDEIARAFDLFSDRSAYAVIVHCTAGKDRTGIVIALLLELLGVSRDQIAEDYELSNESIPRLIEYLEAKGRRPDLPREQWEARLVTPAERIAELLELVDRDYGSARDYLTANGVSEESLHRIVDLLVE